MNNHAYHEGEPTYWETRPVLSGLVQIVLLVVSTTPFFAGIVWYFWTLYQSVASMDYVFVLPPAWAPYVWFVVSVGWATCFLPLLIDFDE